MKNFCDDLFFFWRALALVSLASRVSVLGKAVLGLGLRYFLCPWPWPRALCPRLHLCREIVESKLEDGQCCFRPGRSTTDQIFTLKQIFEKSWEYGKDLFACFVDLVKAYDRVPRDKLWKVLREYGVNGQLLRSIKSFYCRPEVCVRVNGKQSKPFHVGVGLRQGCVLSPLLFIVYMNWIDKCSQADGCATIGNCKISRLLFADDLVLLSSTESGLQRALNSFADACMSRSLILG